MKIYIETTISETPLEEFISYKKNHNKNKINYFIKENNLNNFTTSYEIKEYFKENTRLIFSEYKGVKYRWELRKHSLTLKESGLINATFRYEVDTSTSVKYSAPSVSTTFILNTKYLYIGEDFQNFLVYYTLTTPENITLFYYIEGKII